MSTTALPRSVLKALLPVLGLLKPVLDPPLAQAGRLPTALGAFACRANPPDVRRRIAVASAVYVAWDARRTCRYVGSVCREGPTAVGDRLAEHYRDQREGKSRRANWALLTVLPLHADLPVGAVRSAEGWAARVLGPLDGTAHPIVDLAIPPAMLAVSLTR